MAMANAATFGHVDMLKLLCSDPRSTPGASHNRAVRHAMANQQLDAATYLISDVRVDPNNDGGDLARNLLCLAIDSDTPQDKTTIVGLLLDRGADPNCFNHEPLRLALGRSLFPVLDAIIRCPRTAMTRGEFYAVLAAIPGNAAHHGTLRELMHSARFRHNFT